MSRPLQISAETAQMLAKQLGMPLEHIMHMPKHILVQKLTELAAKQSDNEPSDTDSADQHSDNPSSASQKQEKDS